MVDNLAHPVVPRLEITERAAAIMKSWRPGSTQRTLALVGGGGSGKTTAAQLIAQLPQVRSWFPGGVLRLDIGESVSGGELALRINFLIEQLGGGSSAESDPGRAGTRLGALLENRPPTLLIVDDVWTAEHLDTVLRGGNSCLRLITTRILAIVPTGNAIIRVEEMSSEQSMAVLRSRSDISERHAHRLVNLCGRWPLVLSLTSAAVADMVSQGASADIAAETYAAVLESVGPIALDEVSADSHRGRLVAATIEASQRRLSADQQLRFLELAIFPDEFDIPREALELLWRATAGMNRAQTDLLCHRLSALSLTASSGGPSLRLHDIVRTYLRRQLGDSLASVNMRYIEEARLLVAPSKSNRPSALHWWRLPGDAEFLATTLVFHLIEAGLRREAERLVQDLRWIRRRIMSAGTAAAEVDLLAVGTAATAKLRATMARNAHLLVPIDGSPDSTTPLVNHLVAFSPQTSSSRLVRDREAGCLVPQTPVPESGRSAIMRVLAGHDKRVSAVAVSHDGTWIASCGSDGEIRLWDVATGRLRRTLLGHTTDVTDLVISPDDTWIASAGTDRTVRVWDAATGTERCILRGHAQQVIALAVFPSGHRVASASYDGTVRVWNIAQCRAERVWHIASSRERLVGLLYRITRREPPEQALTALAISPDGARIAIGTWRRGVEIRNASTGQLETTLVGGTNIVGGLIFLDGGERVATGRDGGVGPGTGSPVQIWNLPEGTLSLACHGHKDGGISRLVVGSEPSWLASSSWDATVRIWNARTGNCTAILYGHTNGVTALAISPDGAWLVSGSADGTIRVWDVKNLSTDTTDDRLPEFTDLAVDPRGRWLAAGGKRILRLADLKPYRIRRDFDLHVWGSSLTPSVDGRWLAIVDALYVHLLDVRSGRIVRSLVGHTSNVRAIASSRNFDWVATSSQDASVRIWSTATGQTEQVLRGHTGWITDLAVMPDDNTVVSTGHDRTVRVWDRRDGTLRHVLVGHTGWITSLACCPTGSRIATGGDDAEIKIWHVSSGSLLATLRGHTGRVTTMSWAPDGSWLVSGSYDGTARVWDVKTGTQQHILQGHNQWIEDLAVSRDGTLIATAGWDDTLRVWDSGSGQCTSAIRTDGLIRSCSWLGDGPTLTAAGTAGVYVWSYLGPGVSHD